MRIVPCGNFGGIFGLVMASLSGAVASALVKEFGFDEAFASEVAAAAGSINIARWMAVNIRDGKAVRGDVAGMAKSVSDFNGLKPKLKARGEPIDITKYDYPGLLEVIGRAAAAPKTMTQLRTNLPPEIIAIATRALGVAKRMAPSRAGKIDQDGKALAFQWVSQLYDAKLKESAHMNVISGGEKQNSARAINRLNEDRREISDALGEYLAFMMGKPGARPLSDFHAHWELSSYLDSVLSPEEIEGKYKIGEPEAGIPGTTMIGLPNGYRAVKVTEYSDRFADELCRSARWCVRDKRMFDSYNISPSNPLYLLLKGNQQIGLLSFGVGQFKDAQDASIEDSKLIGNIIGEVYEATKSLANAEGTSIPVEGDFMAFVPYFSKEGKLNSSVLLGLKRKLKTMEDENGEAEGNGETPPHDSDAIASIESSIEELVGKYAPDLVKTVASEDIPLKEKIRIMSMVVSSSRKSAISVGGDWAAKRRENAARAQGAIGEAAERLIRGGALKDRNSSDLALWFAEFSPGRYVSWASEQNPQEIGIEKYNALYSKIASTEGYEPVRASEKEKQAALNVYYSKLFSTPGWEGKITTDLMSGENSILNDVAAMPGKVIMNSPEGLIEVDNSPLFKMASKFRHVLDREKKSILKHVDQRDMFSLTPDKAGEAFRKLVAEPEYDERTGNFIPVGVADDKRAQMLYTHWVNDNFWAYNEIEKKVKDGMLSLGYEDFSYRLLTWDGDLGVFAGKWFADMLNKVISEAKSSGRTLAAHELVAWVRKQCLFG